MFSRIVVYTGEHMTKKGSHSFPRGDSQTKDYLCGDDWHVSQNMDKSSTSFVWKKDCSIYTIY